MMHQAQMLFLVTGKCNMACPHCAQWWWRKDHIDYHMTPDEIRTICRRVKELGLHFVQALIMGGEPALWKHLEEGCRVIRDSGAFNQIHIYSNCKYPDPVIALLDKGLADRVAVQVINMSPDGILRFWEKHAHQMDITQQATHKIHPDKPVAGALPARCGCDQITVFNGQVWSCPGAYHNTKRMGLDVDKPKLYMSVEEDWYSYFNAMNRYVIPACAGCLANGNVWDVAVNGSKPGELT